MTRPKYEDPQMIKDLRERAKLLNKAMVEYKRFYRKKLNDEMWRQTAIARTWSYYATKKELNLVYYCLQQNNKLKKQHSLLNKKAK